MATILETLSKAGLEVSTAEIYLILAQNGEMTVPEILEKTDFSRATVYDSLTELLSKDYVEYRKEGRSAYYKPAHPNHLFGLIEQKKRDVALLEGEMSETMRSLIGSYNMAQLKPGVRFFEGKEGFKEAIYDTLTATETIFAYVDLEGIRENVNDINKKYVEDRRKKCINKKLLIVDSPGSREYVAGQGEAFTEARLLPKEITLFKTGMQIYDNKILYSTFREKNIMSVIIDDPDIYKMHRNMFEFIWNLQSSKR